MCQFDIKEIVFDVDNDLKKEFLKQKPIDTAKSEYPTFVAANEYETILGKPIYDFSLSEADELIMMKFKNSTLDSVVSTVSKLKTYIEFCIRQNKVSHNQNIFDYFTKDYCKKFVSKQAIEFRFISKQQLKVYLDLLNNAQDRGLILSIYEGLRGRTIRGATLEEIINLQIDPHSEDTKKCLVKAVRNNGDIFKVKISQELMDLLIEIYNTKEYASNNAEEIENVRGGRRIYKINRFQNYVFCAIGEKKWDKLNPVVINARFQNIQEWCSNQFITVHNLYMSGMIQTAMNIYKEKNELTKEDYIEICRRYRYGETPERYFTKLKENVELYLEGGIKNV